MESNIPKPIGGRRVERPKTVQPCPACGEALGANYGALFGPIARRGETACRTCHTAIESIWLADWQALLAQEGIAAPLARDAYAAPLARDAYAAGSPEVVLLAQVVVDEFGRHPWTVVDIAMSLLRCKECGGELGENYSACGECGMAFGASILCEFEATGNEHALHIGRWVLRYPQHHSPNAVVAWRLSMPRLLTGWLPPIEDAQRIMALIKAGRMSEVNDLVRQLDQMINQNSK